MRSESLTRWDVLKVAGVALMFIDHAGYFFFDDAAHEWLRGIGRACAPLFFFLAGFAPRYKLADWPLLALATILTAADWGLQGNINTLNMLWSIWLLRLMLHTIERKNPSPLRLHEWLIGLLVLVFTVVIFQYGTLGLLIGLCGYVFRKATDYAPTTPARFLGISLILYGAAIGALSAFSPLTWAAMSASLAALFPALQWFVRAPLSGVEMPLQPALKICARHTALIYVAHLIVLLMLTGKPL